MTNDERVYTTLADAGAPGARMTWGPASCEPPLPFFVYEAKPRSMYADSTNYVELPHYRATLYVDAGVDEDFVSAFRQKVRSLGTSMEHTPRFDENREAYVFTWDFCLLKRV